MAIDPYIARGITPIGEGLQQTLAQLYAMRQGDARMKLAQSAADIDAQNAATFQSRTEQERQGAMAKAQEQQRAAIVARLGNAIDVARRNPQALPYVQRFAQEAGLPVAEQITPDQLDAIAAQAGIRVEALPTPFEQSDEYKKLSLQAQNAQRLSRLNASLDTQRAQSLAKINAEIAAQDDARKLAAELTKLKASAALNSGTKSNATTAPKVTGEERKVAALGVRLEGALRSLGELEKVDSKASSPGIAEKALEGLGMEMLANAARSPNRQQADAAQLDALDAALTLATGAAYTKEQLQNLRKAYFPQIGDSRSTKEAKAKRFASVVQSARVAAGGAEPMINQALDNAAAPADEAGTANNAKSFTHKSGAKITILD